MGKELDLDDVAATSELATRQLAELRLRLKLMRESFRDNMLKLKPEWKGTNLEQQIDNAVDRMMSKRTT